MDTFNDPVGFYSFIYTFIDALAAGDINPVYIGIQIFILLIGLIFSAVFSGSEVAFFSIANSPELLNEKENAYDKYIAKMLDKPRRLLATILIGNTFSNIVASVIAAFVTGNLAAHYGFPDVAVYTIEIVVLTFVILILSEITPKIIAINDPLKVSRRYALLIHFFYVIFAPFSRLIAASTINLEKYLPKPQNKISTEDIIAITEVGEKDGTIHEDEREIIENVIEFGNTAAREIMTSRVNMVALSVESSLLDVISIIQEKGYSRMPMYEGDLDTIIGIVYAKDILPFIGVENKNKPLNWKKVTRKVLFIPAGKKVDDLLRDFQIEKTHIAIVVDEYGGTEGMVTMDDILEEIIGDMADETGEGETKQYRKFNNGIYIFDAQIDLDDMEEIIDLEITSEDDEFESLGGLIYHLKEDLPTVGERTTYKGLELTVQSVENNRIKKVRVKLLEEKENENK